MPRKRETITSDYTKPFPSALRELMKENNTTQQQLADALGKTRQSVSYYCDGSSSPDWEALANIAKYFSVSADWLLGLSDVRSVNTDVKAVCKFTGLSEAAVTSIRRETQQEDTQRALDSIIGYDAESFHLFIENVNKGLSIQERYGNQQFNFELIPEEIRQELFDFFGIDPANSEQTVFQARDRFFTKAENYLRYILLHYIMDKEKEVPPLYSEDFIAEMRK